MARRAPFTDLDTLIAWLNALTPADQVRTARLLADTRTSRDVAAVADATVYEMTRDDPAPAVAQRLGLTVKQVRRAVENHAARQRRESP